MFTQERQDLRAFYFDCWSKYQKKQPLDPLEQQIVFQIEQHPEYQAFFESREKCLDKDFFFGFESANPFLHLGLHLALEDQIKTNRPHGIQTLYQNACKKHEAHTVAHHFMQCLAEALQEARGGMPDEREYLSKLHNVVNALTNSR